MLKKQPIQEAETKNISPSTKTINHIFSDLQYSIFSNLLKRTSDTLFDHETDAMMKSNQLIDSLTVLKKRQIQTTADTQSVPSIFQQLHHRPIMEDQERRVLRRKSPKINPLQFSFQKCMKEIEQNCCRSVANDVKRLFDEAKRLQRMVLEYQIRERKYDCKLEAAEKKYEENLMQLFNYDSLLKKMKETNRQLKKKTEKIKVLEEKNKNMPFQNNFKDQLSNINSSIVKLIKDYIDERQLKINTKANSIKQIENSIQNVLQNEAFDDGCDKCCIFLKKIKGSILGYKAYLTEEDAYIEKIYKKYKKAVFKSD